jgi:RHS repeat-associated protein
MIKHFTHVAVWSGFARRLSAFRKQIVRGGDERIVRHGRARFSALLAVVCALPALGALQNTGEAKIGADNVAPAAHKIPPNGHSRHLASRAATNYLVVDTTIMNYSNHRVDLCAENCFQTRIVVSPTPYISGDRPKTVEAVYSSDAAAVRPVLSVDVSLAPGAPTLTEYWFEAKDSTGAPIMFVNGDTKLRFAPPASPSTKVRLSGQFDAAAYRTGVYPITLVVTAKYSGSTEATTITTRFLVVNWRNNLAKTYNGGNTTNRGWMAIGWSLASYSHLYFIGNDVLIADGTGSATLFTSCGSGCFVSPAGDYTRLSRPGGTGNYFRDFPDSSRAEYGWIAGQIGSLYTRTRDTLTIFYRSDASFDGISDPDRRDMSGRMMASKSFYAGPIGNGIHSGWNILEFDDGFSDNDGRVTQFIFASLDSTLTQWKDHDATFPAGPGTKFLYDAQKRLTQAVNRLGDTTTFAYDSVTWKLASVSSPTIAVDPRLYGAGQTRRLTTTYRDWQTASVPRTSTAATLWTPALSDTIRGVVTDAGGHATAFTVDRWGQPLVVTELPGSSLARTTTFYRRANSPLTDSVRHHEGGLDEFGYSGPLVTYQKLAGQNAINTAYTKFAQPDSVWGTGFPKQVFYLGTRGRVDSVAVVATPDSFRTRYTYDSRFRVTSSKDPAGHITNFYYNALHGNVDSTKAPGNRGTKVKFDHYGRDSASRAASLPWRITQYDLINRALKQITAASTNPDTTIFTYDSLNLRQVRDAESNTYDFTYNALGAVTQRTDPAGNSEKYFFNDEGLPTTWVNRRADTLKTTYDDLHRRLTKSGRVAVTDSFSYATSGRILAAWNQNARDSVFTDSSGWLDSIVTRLVTDPTKRFRVQYRKTAVGQLDSVNVSSNTPIVFTGRRYFWNSGKGTLDSVSLNGQTTVLSRNSELLRSSLVFPVGVTRTESTLSIHNEFRSTYNVQGVDTLLWRNTAFDTVGRVAQYHAYFLSSKDRAKFSYVYDEQGRVKKWIDSTLTYQNNCPPNTDPDFGGFLCAGYVASLVFRDTLSYDRVGNITYSHGLPGTGSVTYNKNRITAWPGYTFAHDSAGNVISRTPTGGPTTYFYWSSDGRLDSVIVGSRKLQYDYNAFGQLVRKRLNGAPVAHFHWDQGHLLAETDASDTLRVAEYAYLPGIDQPLAIVTGATSITTTSYLQQDPLGNVIGGISSGPSVDGSIVILDPWGFHWGPATYGLATSDTNRLRFQGLIYEGDSTQLYYARNRWYDSRTHRFMTEDPVGLAGGTNLYSFGLNDPVNHSDPLGLQSCPHYVRKEDGKCVQDLPPNVIEAEGGGGPTPGIRGGRPWATMPMNWGGAGTSGTGSGSQRQAAQCPVRLTPAESRAAADVSRRTRSLLPLGLSHVIETGAWTFPTGPNRPVPTNGASFWSLGLAAVPSPLGAVSLVHYHPSYGRLDNDYGSLSDRDTIYLRQQSPNGLRRIIAVSKDSMSSATLQGPIVTCPR